MKTHDFDNLINYIDDLIYRVAFKNTPFLSIFAICLVRSMLAGKLE